MHTRTHTHIYIICKSELHFFWWKLKVKTNNTDEGQYKFCLYCLSSTEFRDVCCCCLVAKSCLTHCSPMDYSLPGSSVPGIAQARILEWVALPFFRGSSWLRDRTCVSCIGRRIHYHRATWEAQRYLSHWKITLWIKFSVFQMVLNFCVSNL